MGGRALVMRRRTHASLACSSRQGDKIAMLTRRSFQLGSAAAMAMASSGCRTTGSLRTVRRAEVTGLSAPVEIVDDPYGVPHIRAASIPDAFFGQGYAVARVCLIQIDLSH